MRGLMRTLTPLGRLVLAGALVLLMLVGILFIAARVASSPKSAKRTPRSEVKGK